MSNLDKEIQQFYKSQSDHFEEMIVDSERDREIVKSILQNCLDSCSDVDEFKKSWSGDLQKRFPNGGWRTVNGAKIFINNGKVVAGLDGFNGEIDKFFEGRKGKSSKNKVDISHIDFKYYKPLNEHLKLSAGKNDFFVPKGQKDNWVKGKVRQYKKNVKKDVDNGVFDEAVRQGKLTQKQANDIIESADIKIPENKKLKKEWDKIKAEMNVDAISKLGIKAEEKMQDKIKTFSSNASVKEKLGVIKQFSDKVKKLENSKLTDKYFAVDHSVVSDMADIVSKIDPKMLSKDNRDEMSELEDNLTSLVGRGDWNKRSRSYTIDKDFKSDLESKQGLSKKLDFLVKEIKNQKNDDYVEKHGELSGHEDVLADIQKFISKISKDYINKNTTEILNYKLF